MINDQQVKKLRSDLNGGMRLAAAALRSGKASAAAPVLEMVRLPCQKLSAANLADKLSVACLDLAADGHDRRPTLDWPALETTVVDVHLLSLG